jgi:hypothetical protein
MVHHLRASILLVMLSPGAVMAIEEPRYTVESKTASYEIRSYGSVLIAETTIEASFDDAGNRAFRILADYIFGNNRSKTKLAMTAPVTQQTPSEKIAMTAPVNQVHTIGGFLVQFTMPVGFTLATLPEPNDSRVHLREIPAHRVAVKAYTGSWSEAHYQRKLAELRSALKRDGVRTTGEPVFARFNSPFQIWFLRRNEIWIEVAP